MDTVTLIKPCLLCGKTAAMWCGRCKNAWYCSPDHLQSDWPRHREGCVTVPTPTHTTLQAGKCQTFTASALLFRPGDDGPRTVEASWAVVGGTTRPPPIVQSYFKDSQPCAIVLTQGSNGEPLRYPLHIFYCPLSLSQGSPVNNAIKGITGGAQAKKPWCGPVLVMKFNGSRRQGYSDATSSDFAALSAYFLAYE